MNQDIVYAVKSQLGNAEDNLWRAGAAFRGMPPAKMAEQYGESGKTRQEILDEYKASVDRWRAALAEASK